MAIKFQGFTGGGGAATGGLTYKGTFNATAGTPDISNALQGDLYVIDVAGTIYGQTWAINDHLLVNADMGGVISNSKIDKVDNTSDTALQIANNLSDLNNASTARTNLGLGTAAVEDTGTAVGDMPILVDIGGGVAGFSAVDGSNLTGITASGSLLVANNLSDLNNVTTARTNLGLGSAATTASTDYLAVSNNLSDLNNVTTARSNLGLGTAATTASTDYLAVSNNLSDLNNTTTARTNLGLGTAAVEDTGTAVGDMPILVDIGGGVAGFSAIDGSNLTGITPSGALLVANNLSDLNNTTTARTNLGLGTAATTASSDYLAVANNLSDLNNATTARTNMGLGTAAVEDTGVAVGDMPILVDIGGGVAGFSAIDGSNLTGITASGALLIANNLSDLNNTTTARSNLGLGTAATTASTDYLAVSNNLSDLNNATTARSNLGLGSSATVDTGTTANLVLKLDAAAKIPAVDGSQLTNLPFTGLDVSTVTGAAINANINQAHWITTLGATSVTLTLPLSSGIVDGDTVVVTRIRAGELVIAQHGSDGGTLVNYATTQAASVTIQNNYQMLTVRWNGSAWYIFDQATGTAANEDTGTAVGDVPILVDIGGGVAGFSAIDGSNLTGLPSGGLAAVVDDTTPQLGGSLDVNGQSIVSVSNGDITIAPNGTGIIKTTGSVEPDADLTRTIGAETLRYLTSWTDINGAIRFKAKNDSGGTMTKGQVVYIKGISGSVPTVDLARSNSASTMPAFGLVHANANDQAEVTIITLGNLNDVNTTTWSLSVGDTVYVSSATAGALTNTAPTTEANLIQNIGKVVRADASAGIIKVGGAGRSAATPNLDNDKIFLGNGSGQAVSTSLSAVGLASFNQNLTTATVGEVTNLYYTTGRVDTQVATLPMSTLSDVSYTGGAGIDNYVLTYDHSSSTWGAEAASGGGARPTVTSITTTPYTIGTTDSAIGASELERAYVCSSSAATVNLPTAVGLTGFRLQIKSLLATTVTIDPDSTEHIDHSGQTTYAIATQYTNITLMSDGSNWIII